MTSNDDKRKAEAEEIRAKAWQWRMAAIKEASIAGFIIMLAIVVYITFEKLWPLLPK